MMKNCPIVDEINFGKIFLNVVWKIRKNLQKENFKNSIKISIFKLEKLIYFLTLLKNFKFKKSLKFFILNSDYFFIKFFDLKKLKEKIKFDFYEFKNYNYEIF
ncbi:hypothetical protein ACKWTF_016253 [Chironomus riparius]